MKKKDLDTISIWIHEFCELNVNELLFIELGAEAFTKYLYEGSDVAHIIAGLISYSGLPTGEIVGPDQLWEFYYGYLITDPPRRCY